MGNYEKNIDYLVLDVDISTNELMEIIHTAKKLIRENKEKPTRAMAYLKIAQCFQKSGIFSWSKFPIEKALNIIPDYPEAKLRMGNVYSFEKKYDEAFKSFHEAIRIYQSAKDYKPEDVACAYFMMGRTYDEVEKFNDAIKCYSQAIESKPDYALAYVNRGFSYLKKNLIKNARNDYEQAIKLKNNFVQAYDNLAFCFYIEGKYDDAISHCKKAIKIKPTYAPAYHTLGIILFEQNKFKDSFTYFLKYLQHTKNIKRDEYISTFYYIDKIIFKSNIGVLWKYKDNKKILNLLRLHYNPFVKIFLFCADENLLGDEIKEIIMTVFKFWQASYEASKEKVFVYQYTTIDVLKKMYVSKSLRLSPVQYQNDPEEGHSLYKYILENIDNSLLIEVINDIIKNEKKPEKNAHDERIAFIRSFSEKKDDLLMWRLYGDNGKGVSIGVPTQVLSKGDGFFRERRYYEFDLFPEQFRAIKGMPIAKSGLYKVRYLGDAEFVKFSRKTIELLGQIFMDNNKILEKKHIYRKFIELLFLPITHIIKNDIHKNESEYRQIYISTINESKEDIVEGDDPETGIYIETEDVLFGMNKENKDIPYSYAEIYFGPKVDHLTYIKFKHSFEHKYNEYDDNGNIIKEIVIILSKLPYI